MKALVPAGTYAVCTNGMKMGKMIVTSQTTVKNSKGKLIATLKINLQILVVYGLVL